MSYTVLLTLLFSVSTSTYISQICNWTHFQQRFTCHLKTKAPITGIYKYFQGVHGTPFTIYRGSLGNFNWSSQTQSLKHETAVAQKYTALHIPCSFATQFGVPYCQTVPLLVKYCHLNDFFKHFYSFRCAGSFSHYGIKLINRFLQRYFLSSHYLSVSITLLGQVTILPFAIISLSCVWLYKKTFNSTLSLRNLSSAICSTMSLQF